jgi:ribosome biogenesis GTPase
MPEAAPTGDPASQGIVTAVRPRRITVRIGRESHSVSLPGRLKKGPRETTAPVVVGDRVAVSAKGRGIRIQEVLPRRNEISRVDSLRPLRKQVLAANVDQAVSVVSALEPPLNRRLLDRLLLLGDVAGIRGAVCVNKWDLVDRADGPSMEHYVDLGYIVVKTSALTGWGVDDLRNVLRNRTSLLVGPSGVGKSSLINRLIPGADLRTTPVSPATGRGVHTTSRVDWLDLPSGGVVLDTPGLRHVRPWGLEPENLAGYFPELRNLSQECRFRDCLHRGEPDCAVTNAIDEGSSLAARYDSYLRILASLESGELW